MRAVGDTDAANDLPQYSSICASAASTAASMASSSVAVAVGMPRYSLTVARVVYEGIGYFFFAAFFAGFFAAGGGPVTASASAWSK